MLGFEGSTATRRTPRSEQGVVPVATTTGSVQAEASAEPLWMKVKVAPLSVDL